MTDERDPQRRLSWWEDDEGQQIATGEGMMIRREAADALASYLLPSGLFRRRPQVQIPGNDVAPEGLIADIRSGGGDGDAIWPLRLIAGRIIGHVGIDEAQRWVLRGASRSELKDFRAVYHIAKSAENAILELYGGRSAQPPAVLADAAELLENLPNSPVAAMAAEALFERRDSEAREHLGALRDRDELPADVRRAVDVAYALLAPQLVEI